MNVEQKLQEMKGKTFMYNTVNQKILNCFCDNGTIKIATDKRLIEFPRDQFKEKIKEFLPVGEGTGMEVQVIGMKDSQTLQTTILENIEKLKTDKGYIHQAKAINNSVNTFLNMGLTVLTHFAALYQFI